jgi:hypothetical protein
MKFEQIDRHYKEQRKALSDKYGPRELWSIIDQWPLYCGVWNLAGTLAISDLFRSTLGVPGDIAEFGAWKGTNTMLLAKLLRIFDPLGPKVVHCFDSFEGLQTFASEDGSASTTSRGAYKGSPAELQDMVNLYEMNDEVLLHVGRIEETLPAILDSDAALSFSFVYCDVDLYKPTVAILQKVDPRLVRGGLLVLDEWNYSTCPGETVAVREFLAARGDAYEVESVPRTRHPSLVLRKMGRS